MKITIAERLHPFSHRPGTQCPIPLSTWQATIYPTRIILQKIDSPSQSFILDLAFQGPMKDFTAEIDLEKAVVRVFGSTPSGYLCYEVRRSTDGILFTFEKIPGDALNCTLQGKAVSYRITQKETLLVPVPVETAPAAIPTERLSLGMHKSQDWEMVLRRFDFKEIFPVFMRLGAMFPSVHPLRSSSGTLALLNAFQAACASRAKLQVHAACEQWLLASFAGILVPTFNDTLFQGILPSFESSQESGSLLSHLIEGANLIRSLFFQETEQHWEILPCLLPAFDSGRLINLAAQHEENISLEWSKHQIKKVIIQTRAPRAQLIRFPKEIRSLRLRKSLNEKGRVVDLQAGQATIDLPAHSQLLLDCFKK